MRILNVITSVNPAHGGPIEGITHSTRVLQNEGHEVELVSLDDPNSSWVRECPLVVHAMGPGKGGYGFTPRFVPWLQENHQRFDAVAVRGLWQYGGLGTWRALRETQTPYCVFPHGMLDPWFKKAYPLKHLKKVGYWLWAEHRVLKDAGAVCFTCEEEQVLAARSFRPYSVRGRVVNYGTAWPEGDPSALREEFLQTHPELRGKKVCLFLSRIHPKKGCDLLIRAFAKVAQSNPDLHLVIAGPDQTGWQAELESIAEASGLRDRVTWPGMLRGAQKWGAFNAADVFVLPSHQENFGIVVAEALACGVPVLISDKVNIWREIEASGAGFVAPDTELGVENLLNKWLQLPREEQERMGVLAKDCFGKRFEIHAAAHSLLEVMEEMISHRTAQK